MMAGILVWDVVYYLARYEGGRYFVFVSRWSLITQFAYLFFSFLETLGYSNPRVPVASFLFKIALPASVAVIPLYWGQLLYAVYADAPPIHPSQYFVHGVNALIIQLEWRLVSRRAPPSTYHVNVYGFVNMCFMAVYYWASGCPDCDLDGDGHPYVYAVVDYSKDPAMAVLYCVGAVMIGNWVICEVLKRSVESKQHGY